MFCFLDNTNEALSAILRPGRAGSNTAADHIEVLDQALMQMPDHVRHGTGDPGPHRHHWSHHSVPGAHQGLA